MKLWLVRHPETDRSFEGRCIGQTDIPLSEFGKQSIHEISSRIVGYKPERVISSDLARCRLLGEAVAAACGLTLELDPEWREISFGAWENQTWDHLQRDDGERVNAWMADFVGQTPPGGESFIQFRQRLVSASSRLWKRAEIPIVVITHAGVIRALKAEDPKKAFDLQVPYGSIFEYIPKKD